MQRCAHHATYVNPELTFDACTCIAAKHCTPRASTRSPRSHVGRVRARASPHACAPQGPLGAPSCGRAGVGATSPTIATELSTLHLSHPSDTVVGWSHRRGHEGALAGAGAHCGLEALELGDLEPLARSGASSRRGGRVSDRPGWGRARSSPPMGLGTGFRFAGGPARGVIGSSPLPKGCSLRFQDDGCAGRPTDSGCAGLPGRRMCLGVAPSSPTGYQGPSPQQSTAGGFSCSPEGGVSLCPLDAAMCMVAVASRHGGTSDTSALPGASPPLSSADLGMGVIRSTGQSPLPRKGRKGADPEYVRLREAHHEATAVPSAGPVEKARSGLLTKRRASKVAIRRHIKYGDPLP